MWHRLFPRFCGHFFFSAIRLRSVERCPDNGPVLWLGLHRNGAVDGFVYAAALRRPLVFMISTQLRKNVLSQIFFNGIVVTRKGDEGDQSANRGAMAACLDLLRAGGELAVFPEGTSTLGPRHLPFKAGAVQLTLDWLERDGGVLHVIPIGIHYECPWSFRSGVEVVIGRSIDLVLPADAGALSRLRELKSRVAGALESVGANFPDEVAQRDAEAIATMAALRRDVSRFAVLKACERGELPRALEAWHELDEAAAERCAWRYHGVPLLPQGRGWGEAIELLALAPVVVVGIALNAPAWFGAGWAGKKFPDDTNVIALWKILVGLPLFAIWSAIMLASLTLGHFSVGALTYLVLTFFAWLAYDRAKRRAVALWNGCFHAGLRDPFDRVIAHCRGLDECDL